MRGSLRRRRGSSPLARGLPPDPDPAPRRGRIIPARAGFTGRRWRRCRTRTDHPRSRGVYHPSGVTASTASGSSPLARGLRVSELVPVLRVRIIPARAGFTQFRRRLISGMRDHPRSRGVYPDTSLGYSLIEWIIPARAGFTAGRGPSRPGGWDHPRSRGVYSARCCP